MQLYNFEAIEGWCGWYKLLWHYEISVNRWCSLSFNIITWLMPCDLLSILFDSNPFARQSCKSYANFWSLQDQVVHNLNLKQINCFVIVISRDRYMSQDFVGENVDDIVFWEFVSGYCTENQVMVGVSVATDQPSRAYWIWMTPLCDILRWLQILWSKLQNLYAFNFYISAVL